MRRVTKELGSGGVSGGGGVRARDSGVSGRKKGEWLARTIFYKEESGKI